MASTLPESAEVRLPAKAESPAKALLRKTETDRWKKAVGRAIERTRKLADLTVDEFAGAIGKDERQIRAWVAGEENPQIAAIFAVDTLRLPLIQALSELTQAIVEIRVTLPIPQRRLR